ncbi:hypothetical protein ZWY2020_028009 [Hordeum vulgare]|nr:hypothetical protein ZWY2020_028009 [Hordeum vulgare]
MPPSHVGLDRDAGPIVVAKPRDRFRFDWASTDDTSRVDAANNQPKTACRFTIMGFSPHRPGAKKKVGAAPAGLRCGWRCTTPWTCAWTCTGRTSAPTR